MNVAELIAMAFLGFTVLSAVIYAKSEKRGCKGCPYGKKCRERKKRDERKQAELSE